MRLGMMRELHVGQKFAGVVISPKGKKIVSREDKDLLDQYVYGWLARVLGVGTKKRARSSDEELAELEQSMLASARNAAAKKALDPAKAKKLAELKALVEESLEE